jgi:hypothetical protein
VNIRARHAFPCTVDQYWAMYWDPEYEAMLSSASSVRREPLSSTEDDRRIRQRVRFTPDRTLPGPVAKVVGTDRLTYDWDMEYDKHGKIIRWTVIPAVAADKVTCRGTYEVHATATGCERVVNGEITVRIPFVGGKIEQGIHDSVLEGYDAAARTSLDYLRSKGIA